MPNTDEAHVIRPIAEVFSPSLLAFYYEHPSRLFSTDAPILIDLSAPQSLPLEWGSRVCRCNAALAAPLPDRAV